MLIRRESKMIRDLLPVVMVLFASWARLPAAELVGVTVTPHTVAESMRYRRPRDPDLAARVQMFVTGPARPTTFAGQTPAELLQEGAWAWHDLATEVKVPEGALTVWTFNGKSSRWGVGQEFELQAEGLTDQDGADRCTAALDFGGDLLGPGRPNRSRYHRAAHR